MSNNTVNITADDLRTIAVTAAENIDNTDLATVIDAIPDAAITDAIDTFNAKSQNTETDDYTAGKDAAKNYRA